MDEIKEVSNAIVIQVIETHDPRGLFLTPDKHVTGRDGFTAVDNSTGEAWTEWFFDKQDAISWLNGKFEMSEFNLDRVLH